MNNSNCDNALNLEILDYENEYSASFDYNVRLYDSESMTKFAGIFCRACELMHTMNDNALISDINNML